MKKSVIKVFLDRKPAKTFLSPFHSHNHVAAVRLGGTVVLPAVPNDLFISHITHYQLYRIIILSYKYRLSVPLGFLVIVAEITEPAAYT
jgi:hypothetical protein